MNRLIKIAVLAAGTSLAAGAPVFAQDLNALNPLSGLGIDVDPLHIFTPAPPPPGPAAPVPHRHRHRLAHYAGSHHRTKLHARVHAKLHAKSHAKKA